MENADFIKYSDVLSVEEEKNDREKSSTRSVSYPIRTLANVISFVTKVYTELGHNQYHSNIDIARVNNLAPASIKMMLSTCQQYGLLDMRKKFGYKVSELFVRIYRPIDDKERLDSILESLTTPELYKLLYADYNGHVVPSLNGLVNNLVRKYQIKDWAASKVAETFLENMRAYGFLNEKNVLSISPKYLQKGNGNEEVYEIESNNSMLQLPPVITLEPTPLLQQPEQLKAGIVDIVIPLKSTREKAHLLIPEDYTEEDLDRIAKFVEALK